MEKKNLKSFGYWWLKTWSFSFILLIKKEKILREQKGPKIAKVNKGGTLGPFA